MGHRSIETTMDIYAEATNAKITLVGESAGANLCLALALKTKETKKVACVPGLRYTAEIPVLFLICWVL